MGEVAATAPDVHRAIAAHHARGRRVVLKAPWSTAGKGIQRVAVLTDLNVALRGWIANVVAAQGALIVEPWLDKEHDVSIQIEVRPNGTTRLLEAREFRNDARWQYRGTILGRNFWRLGPEARRLMDAVRSAWQLLAHDVGRALAEAGYRGPAGIDAMIWRSAAGELRFKPLVELNPRWTMGRVALALESHIAAGVRAAWLFERVDAIDAATLQRAYPAHFIDTPTGRKLERGVFFTTDPSTARAVVTMLVAGEEALQAAHVA